MDRSTWKREERLIAKKLNARRTPLSGKASGHTSADIIHPRLYIESKLKSRPPLWDLFYQKVLPRALSESKLPVITLRKKGSPSRMRLWLIRECDIEWIANEIKITR
jgi:hypothetical protein